MDDTVDTLENDYQLLSDTEKLDYIIANMLTEKRVEDLITTKLPEILGRLDDSPILRTLLKFL